MQTLDIMRTPTLSLFIIALPALLAGWLVLAITGVGKTVLATQGAATILMVLFAIGGQQLFRRVGIERACLSTLVLALAACGIPLLSGGTGPQRWLKLGTQMLYIAPVVLPLALVAYGYLLRVSPPNGLWSSGLVIALAAVLAAQPDASQVLSLSLSAAVPLSFSTQSRRVQIGTLLLLLGLCAAAFCQPDPLQPVPYVEGVFQLALTHSLLAGITVLTGACAFLCLLFIRLREINVGMSGVAIYYLVLFGCSVWGLTPAPLIGYGAGPLLGYGVLIAGVAAVSQQKLVQ